MAGRNILLLYSTANSGHHRASCGIANTLKKLDPSVEVTQIDVLRYTSPLVRSAISRTYQSVIEHQPDVWEYLYDNPSVLRHIESLRSLLHRYKSRKLQRLLDNVRPDAIVCTQAYPCGMLADFKRQKSLSIPLIAVLTDYAPHIYWFHKNVDYYVVPSLQVKKRFIDKGVDDSKLKVLGIPIDAQFLISEEKVKVTRQFGLNTESPIILIMSGGRGFGRIADIVKDLDLLPQDVQIVVLAGTNKKLLRWLNRETFRHQVKVFGYTEHVAQLMSIANILISKPGGLTTSEALVKHLPLVMVNPIPGQEAYNARYLLSQGAAIQAPSPHMIRQTVRDLLDNPARITELRNHIIDLAKPMAAFDIARLTLESAEKYYSKNASLSSCDSVSNNATGRFNHRFERKLIAR